jgi:suppressor of ftsI
VDPITRRQLLISGSTLAGSAALAKGAKRTAGTKKKEPVVLECKWIEKTMDGVRMKLRSYNGQVPGPLIDARPGENLRIRIKNSLPPESMNGWNHNHNVPHMFNSTNLHLHGLDIAPHLFAPLGTGDPLSRMISIEPGHQFDYEFQIPDDQTPGLCWYHPHHHGSTAVQVASGMAGALIVRGDIDELPEIKAARDILLAIQDIGLFPSETEPDLWTYEPKQNAIWDTMGSVVTMYNPKTGKTEPTDLKGGFSAGDYKLRYFLLNGEPFYKETHNTEEHKQNIPIGKQLPVQRFSLAPGEVVRFRMLNACSDNYMPIVVEQHDLHLIALDSVNLEAPKTIPPPPPLLRRLRVEQIPPNTADTGQVAIAPGGRAEFLIKANAKPGIYRIIQLAQRQQFLESEQKTIAEIEVTGAAKDMALPSKLPIQKRYYPPMQASEVKRVRNFVFSGIFPATVNPYVGIDFLINNNTYDELAVPHVVELNSVEEWHVQVLGAHHGGTEGHPFHIHVNHFEVISITDDQGKTLPPPPGPVDTVWVPLRSTVVIRMKFLQWKGKSVFHCHILPHEDTGMMQNFLIV